MENQDCCSNCIHKDVCMYKEKLQDVANAIKTLQVYKDIDGRHTMIPIGNYTFIRNIDISCKHFYRE